MHALYSIHKALYQESIEQIVQDASRRYQKTCYISFNDPFRVVVNFLGKVKNIDHNKFIVVDASSPNNEKKEVDSTTYTIPTHDIFRVYMLLRDLIIGKEVDLLMIDSLSALISRFSDFPLKRMMSDLLLEVGQYRCNTSSIIFNHHQEHEIVDSIRPMIGKNVIL